MEYNDNSRQLFILELRKRTTVNNKIKRRQKLEFLDNIR
jgi:hypothetical protein